MQNAPVPVPQWSLRRRLALGLALATLAPVLVFAGLLLQAQWQGSRDALVLQLDADARLSAGVIDDGVDADIAALELLAEQLSGDPARDGSRLSRFLEAYPSMLRVRMADADGRVMLARDSRGRPLAAQVVSVERSVWFRQVRQTGRVYVSGALQQPEYG